MKKIKIVEFIHGLNMGGAETLVKDYVLGLDRNKIDLIVLCLSRLNSPWDNLIIENNIKVMYVSDFMKYNNKNNIFARAYNKIDRYRIVKKILREINPDVIHYHLRLSNYLEYANLSQNTRIIYTQHFDVKHLKKAEIKRMKNLQKKYNYKIIALHDDMKHQLNKMFSVDNTVVLNNGINMERFNNVIPNTEMRKALNIPENAFVIGHIGRFSKEKNHKFLVEVFNEVNKRKPNSFLLMVGNGVEIANIKTQLNNFNLNDNYLILQDRTDIPDLLNVMDYFVFPSISEGLGIALVEAQVASKPCLVSSSVPEYVDISNLITRESLSETADKWADIILNTNKKQVIYYNKKDWDMKKIIKKLEYIYRGDSQKI